MSFKHAKIQREVGQNVADFGLVGNLHCTIQSWASQVHLSAKEHNSPSTGAEMALEIDICSNIVRLGTYIRIIDAVM